VSWIYIKNLVGYFYVYSHFKAHVIRQEYLDDRHNLEDRETHCKLLRALIIICFQTPNVTSWCKNTVCQKCALTTSTVTCTEIQWKCILFFTIYRCSMSTASKLNGLKLMILCKLFKNTAKFGLKYTLL